MSSFRLASESRSGMTSLEWSEWYGVPSIESKAATVAASELGKERVLNGREHMSQRGQ